MVPSRPNSRPRRPFLDAVPRYGRWVHADAEEARKKSGMIALYPRDDQLDMLAVPNGELPEHLHVTLAYLGNDVTDQPDPIDLANAVGQISDRFPVITARVMGHAVFNPDGGAAGDQDPAAVYLLGDSVDLDTLHAEVSLAVVENLADVPKQHAPWIPHITTTYGDPPEVGQFTGDVEFDRIGLAWGDQVQFYPFIGSLSYAASAGYAPHWPLG